MFNIQFLFILLYYLVGKRQILQNFRIIFIQLKRLHNHKIGKHFQFFEPNNIRTCFMASDYKCRRCFLCRKGKTVMVDKVFERDIPDENVFLDLPISLGCFLSLFFFSRLHHLAWWHDWQIGKIVLGSFETYFLYGCTTHWQCVRNLCASTLAMSARSENRRWS